MSVGTILVEIEKFIVVSMESIPGVGALGVLVAVAVAVRTVTAVAWWLVAFVVTAARVVMSAVASASLVVAACLVFAVLALTG